MNTRPIIHLALIASLAFLAFGAPQPPTEERLAGAWSKNVNGLTARLIVSRPTISESDFFELTVELKHIEGIAQAIQVHNPFTFKAKILDSQGNSVGRTSARIDVLSSPMWVVLPWDSYLGFPVTANPRNRAKGSHIDITTDTWRLNPGRYTINGEYMSDPYGKHEDKKREGNISRPPFKVWEGKINLPPVSVEIVPKS